jgi:hypothetical protein
VVSLSGVRLALFAAFVVLVTWRLYRPRLDEPHAPALYKGAMAGGMVLAVLALFNGPGFLGAVVAMASIGLASVFVLAR